MTVICQQNVIFVIFCLLCCNYNFSHTFYPTTLSFVVVVDAMTINNNVKPAATASTTTSKRRVGCKVCVSSTCKGNGSEMLLDALETITATKTTNTDQMAETEKTETDNDVIVEFKSEYCLGGCCRGVIVKPFGTNTRRQTIPGIINSEEIAIDTAKSLLGEWDIPYDENVVKELSTKAASGEKVLCNSEPPEVCQNCGVAPLQLYRGNCAKCGRYPY